MTTTHTDVDVKLDDPDYAANLRRATLASSIGSALEYFDFALYGLSTALIFNVLFFDQSNPAMATVAAFATFGVGFVARGRAEAVCPVEALRPFVLFIDIHSCHPLFADGEGEQCPSQSAAEKVGM